MKLAVAIGDVGQAPKVKDLAQSEGVNHNGELTGEADTTVLGGAACSSDEAGGFAHRRARIALDAIPTWRASCRRVETTTSMLFESMSEYGLSGGSGGLRNTRITQIRRNSYPSSGQFSPYIQQLMILYSRAPKI
jgi:hypothetical protein